MSRKVLSNLPGITQLFSLKPYGIISISPISQIKKMRLRWLNYSPNIIQWALRLKITYKAIRD